METLKLYRVEIKGLGKFDKVLDNQNMQQAKAKIKGAIITYADLDKILSEFVVSERNMIQDAHFSAAAVFVTRLS